MLHRPVSYTHLDVYKRQLVHDATRVIPAKLVVTRKIRIPGNVMFESHETEFEERENYPSQGWPPRSPGRVLLRRRFASSGRTGLRRGQCYDSTEQSTRLSNAPERSRCKRVVYVLQDAFCENFLDCAGLCSGARTCLLYTSRCV